MRISLSLIGVLYIIIVGSLCHILSVPELIKAFLALPAFLIIPQQTGELSIIVLKRILKGVRYNFDIVSRFVVVWMIGVVTLVLSIIILSQFSFWNSKLYVLLLIFLMIIRIISVKNTVEDINMNINNSLNNFFGDYKIIFLLMILGAISFIFLKHYQPLPLQMSHAHPAWHSLTFIMNDSIYIKYGHIPVVSILDGIISMVFNVFPIWAHSTINLLGFIVYTISVYLISYQLSKKKSISIIAAFTSLWIIGSLNLDNFIERSYLFVLIPLSLFLIHKNILIKKSFREYDTKQLIFVFLLIPIIFLVSIIGKQDIFMKNVIILLIPLLVIFASYFLKNKNLFLLLSLITMIFYFMHDIECAFGVVLISGFILSHYILKKYKYAYLFFYLFFIFVFLFVFLQHENILTFNEKNMISKYTGIVEPPYNPDFSQKYDVFKTWTGESVLFISFVGSILFLIKREDRTTIIIIPLLMMVLIYFFPEGHFWRIGLFLNFVISYIFAYTIIYFIKLLKLSTNKNMNKYLVVTFVLFMCVILSTTIILPKNNYIIHNLNHHKQYSYGTLYEYSTAFWIIENTPKIWVKSGPFWTKPENLGGTMIENTPHIGTRHVKISKTNDTLLISDPYTMFMMSKLSGRDQVVDAPVWVYEPEYHESSIEQMQNLKKNVFLAKNSSDAYKGIQRIKRNHTVNLIIINSRTSHWLKQDKKQFIWWPSGKIDWELFNKFYDGNYFTLLHNEGDDIYVFGVNPEPGVSFKISGSL